jgi:hypothetical protein
MYKKGVAMMKMKKNNILFILLFSFAFTLQLKAELKGDRLNENSKSHLEKAVQKTKLMSKELSLTLVQQQIVAAAIAKRDLDNSEKIKGLMTQDEKKVVCRTNYLEYVSNLKAQLPALLVTKITTWEANYESSQKVLVNKS